MRIAHCRAGAGPNGGDFGAPHLVGALYFLRPGEVPIGYAALLRIVLEGIKIPPKSRFDAPKCYGVSGYTFGFPAELG